MNFTKYLLLAAAGLSMASCSLDKDNDKTFVTKTVSTANLIIPSSGESFATSSTYSMTFYPISQGVELKCADLRLGMVPVSFTTTRMSYTAFYVESTYAEITKFSGGTSDSNGLSISNLSGSTSMAVNLIGSGMPSVPNFPAYPNGSWPEALVLQYTVNSDYTVKTFPFDAVYPGKTTVYTKSTGESFTHDGMAYRVLFNANFSKANVVFYNAKFAENMPFAITFVLEDLDVVFNKTGYAIVIPEGERLIPLYVEGGKTTPFPAYQFTSFVLSTTSNDLTEVSIDYTVEGGMGSSDTYFCSSSGSYLYSRI